MVGRNKKKKSNFLFIIIFLLGLAILVYPLISRLYYRVEANEKVEAFEAAKDDLTDEEVRKRLELARTYNESLNNHIEEDPYSKEKLDQARAEYARMLELKEQIGHIQIPKIDLDIPVYAGTSEEVLQIGAGHLEGTSLPIGGESTHSVITAHSGLPNARLFTDLNQLKAGDRFFFYNLGGVMAYQVDQIKVVEPSNFSDLLVVEGQDYMTLLTCTPIMINSHRLLVRGHRVPYNPGENEVLRADSLIDKVIVLIFYLALAISLILLIRSFMNIRLKRKLDGEYERLVEKRRKDEK